MVLHTVNPTPRARDHAQVVWSERLAAEARLSAQTWFREDYGFEIDWTSAAIVDNGIQRSLTISPRTSGVIAGLRAVEVVVNEFQEDLAWASVVDDGDYVQAGSVIGRLAGSVRSILPFIHPITKH